MLFRYCMSREGETADCITLRRDGFLGLHESQRRTQAYHELASALRAGTVSSNCPAVKLDQVPAKRKTQTQPLLDSPLVRCVPVPALLGLGNCVRHTARDFLRNRVAGRGSVRKLDAHQGVPAEMAYIRSSIAQANGIDRGGTTNSYLTRGSVNNALAIFRSPEST
jgi:hypothetical protein